MMSKHYVFVYGTLLSGYGNWEHFLNNDKAKIVGEYETTPNYTMYNLGAFPGVVMGGDTAIKGEVYEVDDEVFRALDGLEGYPSFYDRTKIPVVGLDTVQPWIYHIGDAYTTHSVVASGNWRDR